MDFDQLFRTLARGLELIALRTLGDWDEARDAVQESMARALEAVRDGKLPAGVPIGAFVRGIARHVIADVVRRRVRARGVAIDEAIPLPAPDPTALERLIGEQRVEAVRRALARLPHADRKLLVECIVHGRSSAELAARQGVSAERIRKRKSRALERLRTGLRNAAGSQLSSGGDKQI